MTPPPILIGGGALVLLVAVHLLGLGVVVARLMAVLRARLRRRRP